MPRRRNISLSTLIDFSQAPPTRRFRIVQDAVELYEGAREREFDPRYYKPLGDEIVGALRADRDLVRLDELCARQESVKRSNYEACVVGLRKWLRSRPSFTINAAARPVVWPSSRLSVLINPEIDATINDRRLWLKFYFKSLPLSKANLDPVLYLLDEATRATRPADVDVGILDLRQPHLFTNRRLSRSAGFSLHDVLQSLENCWFEALRMRGSR